MAKSPKKDGRSITAAGRARIPPQSASITETDIACRAFDLFLARGCQHGHDVEDWLRAERELKNAANVSGD